MDRISWLSNELVLNILSWLPTKDVLTTSLLSKRWRYLWKSVPKLTYLDVRTNVDHGRFVLFVDRSMRLNTAQVLESLSFKVDRQFRDVDIGFWIRSLAERGLSELSFEYYLWNDEPPWRLPQSFFTCTTLVALKLDAVSLVGVEFSVSFPLLKTLHLKWVIFLDNESPGKLLSSCPTLEDLVLFRSDDDNVMRFSVTVPSLQRLCYRYSSGPDSELVMNTPSLKYFETLDRSSTKCMIEYMPKIVKADVAITCSNTDDVLRSLTSVKRLYLCLPPKATFPTGNIFPQLVHLRCCTHETDCDLLISVLEHSPNLRSLKLDSNVFHAFFADEDDIADEDVIADEEWIEPISVPETLTFIETFEWRNYRGLTKERKFAAYILKHSSRLKTATFSPDKSELTILREKNLMLRELSLLKRGSTECQLVFD